MPVDISEAPETSPIVSKTRQPGFTSNVSRYVFDKMSQGGEAKADVKHADILAVIPRVSEKLQELYPELPTETINDLCDFYFGIYRMDEASLSPEGRKKFEEKKVRSAKIQHNRAHAIFYASLGEGGPEYAQKVLNSVAAHESIARSASGKETGALLLNTGINTFIATSRFLYESGYDIFVPNYTGDAQEVREWDVDRGIDGCAIKMQQNGEPHVLLFDAKGQANYSQNDYYGRKGERREANVHATKLIWQEAAHLPQSLRDTISFYDPEHKYSNIYKARIMVPTFTDCITYFETAWRKYQSEGPVAVLNQLARFSPEVTESLKTQLDYSLKKASAKR